MFLQCGGLSTRRKHNMGGVDKLCTHGAMVEAQTRVPKV